MRPSPLRGYDFQLVAAAVVDVDAMCCIRSSSTSIELSVFSGHALQSKSGRPVDVDNRDDLHDRSPGQVRRPQHFQRHLLVFLSGEPRHLQ